MPSGRTDDHVTVHVTVCWGPLAAFSPTSLGRSARRSTSPRRCTGKASPREPLCAGHVGIRGRCRVRVRETWPHLFEGTDPRCRAGTSPGGETGDCCAPPKKRVRRSRIMSRFVIIRGRGARGAAKATRLRRSAPPGTRSGEAAIFAECEVGRPLPSRGEPIFDVSPECTRASGAAPRPRRICLCGWRVERGCTAREADERTSA